MIRGWWGALLGAVLLAAAGVASQPAGAEALVTLDGTAESVPLLPARYVLDPGGALGLADARARLDGPSAVRVEQVFSQGYTGDTIWLRAEIEVEPAAAGVWFLALELSNFDHLDVYPSWVVDLSDPAAAPAFALGDRVPEGRAVRSRFHLRRLTLPAGRHTILVRGRTSSTLTLPLRLWWPDALHEAEQGFLVLQGFYLGLAALLAVSAVAIGVYLRQAIFLIFAGNAVSHGMLWLILNGVGPGFIWPGLARTVEISSHGFVALAVASVLAFSAAFLAGTRMPRIVGVIMWSTAAMALALGIAVFATPREYSLWLNMVTNQFLMPTALILIVGTIVALVRGAPAARLLALAWSGLAVGALVALARDFGLVPSNVLTYSGPQLGSTLEMLVFAFMLAGRVGRLQREKERLQAQALAAAREQEARLERRVAERTAALDAANRQLSAIVESAPFPLILESGDSDAVLFMNRRAADLLAISAGPAAPAVPVRFVRPEVRASILDELAREGVAADREVELRRPDGSTLWTLHSAVRLDYDGRPVRLVAFNDISSMKALESYLRSAAAQDREARRIQRQFVEMVSHEFRSPLALIDGAAQNMTVDDPRDLNRIQKIRGAVQRLLRMIEDCLAQERGGSGRLELKPECVDLRLLLAEAVEHARAAAPGHEIRLDPGAAPAAAACDRRLLEIAVGNLLANATRYSPAGSTVWVTLATGEHGREIRVADEGPGVAESERGRIFEKFYRSPATTGTPGAGLGLHLVRMIVDAHGGLVTCGERPGGGSVFIVRLPASPTAAAAEGAVVPTEARA